MEPVTRDTLEVFLRNLGERSPGQASLYLMRGSALCLLGNPRTTIDIDYELVVDANTSPEFQEVLADLLAEMHLDAEEVPLAEFIPLPPEAYERRRFFGRYGRLNVYIFDLYSIALSKISRGFEADLEDTLLQQKERLIELEELERHFKTILPRAREFDIIPSEFSGYFEQVRRRIAP